MINALFHFTLSLSISLNENGEERRVKEMKKIQSSINEEH
jgi:hypothetical protein